MKLTRTLSADLLNAVVNHPQVRPWLGSPDVPFIDVSPLVCDPANVALVTDHGGFIFHAQGDGVYEVHTQFVPEGRGRDAAQAMWEARRYMFVETDCVELVTKVPDGNRGADSLSRLAGFEERFRREGVWQAPEGTVGVSYRSLGIQAWSRLDDVAADEGAAFHEELEGVKAANGSARPVHPDDPAHDAAAGAASLMIKAGNAMKGVAFYNRWARLAGYQTIELLSLYPVVVDLRDAVVEVRKGRMEVLLCR